MTLARIYLPTKNAMQSGKAKDSWKLELVAQTPYFTDDLTGWTGMKDTVRQINLFFNSAEEAIEYAGKHGIEYELEMPNPQKLVKKAYADNFSFTKIKRHP